MFRRNMKRLQHEFAEMPGRLGFVFPSIGKCKLPASFSSSQAPEVCKRIQSDYLWDSMYLGTTPASERASDGPHHLFPVRMSTAKSQNRSQKRLVLNAVHRCQGGTNSGRQRNPQRGQQSLFCIPQGLMGVNSTFFLAAHLL